jgi:hypothetical protein
MNKRSARAETLTDRTCEGFVWTKPWTEYEFNPKDKEGKKTIELPSIDFPRKVVSIRPCSSSGLDDIDLASMSS